MKIAILGNFLPRRCGIATFTSNLAESIIASNKKDTDVFVIAMENGFKKHKYPEIVKQTISQQVQSEYIAAAKTINDSKADVCIIQHEFGIFGGESGVFILSFMEQVKIPIITTVHTVLKTPSYHERHIIKKMGLLSQKMIVMSKMAVDFLQTIYQVPKQKIKVIEHGVPDFSSLESDNQKFNYPSNKILGTFGFLGRSKGIETVINALPEVVKEHPEVIYVVMGQTHPNVKKDSGEEYRDYLKKLAENNGVAKNLLFEDGFFTEEDLKIFLNKLDLYITPYLNEAQITSGTISYAIGAGACIVSTPFWHAKELLANGRGKTFPFGDSPILAKTLCELLENPSEIATIKSNAFNYGKGLYWNSIGALYNDTLKIVVQNHESVSSPQQPNINALPVFSMNHIQRLTDDFGILEHANYSIPDYKEGYCLDDNVRALILVLQANKLEVDSNANRLVDTYLRYIKLMQKEDGYFHNDMSFSKTFLDETGSEDSFGRTIWAMGYLIRLAPNDSHFQFAKDVFFTSYHNFEEIKSIRAIASTIIGLYHFLKRYPDNEGVIHTMRSLTSKLIKQYNDESSEHWKWFEPVLSYDNAMLPLAIWHAYELTKDKEFYQVAIDSTTFLDKKTCINNKLSLIGNSWDYKDQPQQIKGGQQPIDTMAMVMLYSKAYEILKDNTYYTKMHIAFSWFLGNNDLLLPLYDDESNGCCDGLELTSVNRNQGAESTISYLLSYLTVWQTEIESASVDRFFDSNKVMATKTRILKAI
ncbi:glycosyltransferase [Maribacter algarum]|uniref:Glycosyltransferase n=1 Tax=Maribacter algarum (ex Zhang et al. 2020) TaxID=2578118 RepID=A0A5S3PQ32_9FLAO|nr:glycosyltransferase family 4 protein [Maribacter algarum]TMM56857.1 glycosyltransferase [Maribacter algarum]